MTEPLYALTLDQNVRLEEIYKASKRTTRPATGVAKKERPNPQGVVRLMTIADEFPVYNSLETRPAAVFELSRETVQATVKFVGENLWGNVRLTVGDITVILDCRATGEELRYWLSGLPSCRATVLPGLWEFVFDGDVTELPTITCEPVITSSSVRFLGGCIVTREGWKTISEDRETVATVDVIDAIPFIEGELKRGAMALGIRSSGGFYLAGQWSCPAFTFRSL